MIQDYLELYPQALWVQIAQQQMSLLSPSQTLLAQEMWPISFDSLDSFAVNYPVAEHHFAQLLQQANLKWNEFGQPIVFIQLMDRTEAQLDGIEIQAIREIALSANARMVQIFFKNGEALAHEKLPVRASRTFRMMMIGLIVLYLIALAAVLSLEKTSPSL